MIAPASKILDQNPDSLSRPSAVSSACPMNRPILFLLAALVLASVASQPLATEQAQPAHNPLIWADVPDIAMIRVGKTYYMSSTTMHMSPGLPIMKSADLVNWRMASYAYNTLADNEALRLENGKNAYGLGSWASSLRFHNGVFYASTFSATTGRTHIYTTRDPERGPWKETSFAPVMHDHSLFFDDDGRVYMVFGGGRITLTELQPDLSGIKPGGVNKVLVENVNTVFGADQGGLNGEGSQLFKINGRYYLFNIASPGSRWARTVIVHRADAITGPYEGRIALDDRGIAQGGLIDTPEGKWYAYLFKDNGAVGRIPYLVPVTWKDGWPVLGENGKAPMTLDIPAGGQGVSGVSGIVASDEFDRRPGDPDLPLAWQWNHNPEPRNWSLTKRPGYLSFVTSRVVSTLSEARNTLTQRTFGPRSSATTSIDVSGMKDGDYAGIAAFQRRYGFVGVKMSGGARSLVMVSADSDKPEEIASVPLSGKTVHLKVECEFSPAPEVARFSYSLDGRSWTPIGRPSALKYTVPHFMGYRFAIFYYSTKTAGGRVDFDYYRIGQSGNSQ
jgi:beta-xylosidase